jgi:hypothetical protein
MRCCLPGAVNLPVHNLAVPYLSTHIQLIRLKQHVDDGAQDIRDLERRHAAVMVAVADMRAKIDRQKNRVAAEFEAYRTLEKQAIALYDAESELANKILDLKTDRSQV